MSKELVPSNQIVHLVAQARRRQLLGLMGLQVWTKQNAKVISVDYDEIRQTNFKNNVSKRLEQLSAQNHAQDVVDNASDTTKGFNSNIERNKTSADSKIDIEINDDGQSEDIELVERKFENTAQPLASNEPNQDLISANVNSGFIAPVAHDSNIMNRLTRFDTDDSPSSPSATSQVTDENFYDGDDINHTHHSNHTVSEKQTVADFTLYGARYFETVVIIDAKVLEDTELNRLWQNIVQGLSLNLQQLQFPICEGINDHIAAQASVAGFIFSLGDVNAQESASVVALTALPDGVTCHELCKAPTLSDMLAEPDLKQTLWQLIRPS